MTEKSLPQPSSPQMKGNTFTKYSLIWAAAALVSLLYLFLLATQPDLVVRYLGAGPQTAENEAMKKAIGNNVAEVRMLRESIDQFRSELIEMRSQVASQSDATRDLMTRVGTLEAEPAEPQKVAAADTPAAKAKEAAAAKKAPKDAAAKKPAAKAESALETGSVAQSATGEAITFGPPTVTPATASPSSVPSNQVGVQIATGPSVDSLRLSWTLLNERHGDTMRALQPRYKTEMAGGEQTYDLIVGPVASVDEARKLCQELAMKATPCTVARYTGDAL